MYNLYEALRQLDEWYYDDESTFFRKNKERWAKEDAERLRRDKERLADYHKETRQRLEREHNGKKTCNYFCEDFRTLKAIYDSKAIKCTRLDSRGNANSDKDTDFICFTFSDGNHASRKPKTWCCGFSIKVDKIYDLLAKEENPRDFHKLERVCWAKEKNPLLAKIGKWNKALSPDIAYDPRHGKRNRFSSVDNGIKDGYYLEFWGCGPVTVPKDIYEQAERYLMSHGCWKQDFSGMTEEDNPRYYYCVNPYRGAGHCKVHLLSEGLFTKDALDWILTKSTLFEDEERWYKAHTLSSPESQDFKLSEDMISGIVVDKSLKFLFNNPEVFGPGGEFDVNKYSSLGSFRRKVFSADNGLLDFRNHAIAINESNKEEWEAFCYIYNKVIEKNWSVTYYSRKIYNITF